jgi:hypothetical protein
MYRLKLADQTFADPSSYRGTSTLGKVWAGEHFLRRHLTDNISFLKPGNKYENAVVIEHLLTDDRVLVISTIFHPVLKFLTATAKGKQAWENTILKGKV